jgi:hypothetical protein
MGTSGLSANDTASKLFTAYKNGDLKTDAGRTQFMSAMGVKPED